MANETEMRTLPETLAGQVGRLQAEIMMLEGFLKNISKREDVPTSIRLGADYYLKNLRELRENGDL